MAKLTDALMFCEKIPDTAEARKKMKGWVYQVDEDSDYNGGSPHHKDPFYFIEVRLPPARFDTLTKQHLILVSFGGSAALNGWSPPLHGTEKHIKERDTMKNDHALHTRRDLIVKAGLLTLSSAVAPSLASATIVPAKEASSKDAPRHEQTRSPITFVLDKNLNLPTDQEPWVGMLKTAGIEAHATTDLVHIGQLLAENGPDIAYIPGADFCRLILQGNPHYQGLVIGTSKFTGEPYQRTLLVVRKDDPANSIDDLAGATYGYMNKSCSSSYFPPAIMLNRQGKNFEQFLKLVEVPGWQNRVDAVVAKKIRSTMILDDVWKMTPRNEQTCKIIGEMDDCPPSILAVNKRLDIETVGKLREQALSYIPSWQTVYGAFRPYNYADVQSFTHYLSELPADVNSTGQLMRTCERN